MRPATGLGLCMTVWFLAAPTLALTAQPDPTAPIVVEELWARRSPMMPRHGHHGRPTGNGAAYASLRNSGSEEDALIGAETDAAEMVELHETIVESGVMRMRPVTRLSVPPGGSLELRPGGLHLMLINLRRDLRPGDRFTLSLTFERAGRLVVDVPVR